MNTLVVFLISMIFLLTVLIKFKWSASVGLVLATILMGLLSGMQVGELTGFISGGFGNTMTSTGLVIIFGLHLRRDARFLRRAGGNREIPAAQGWLQA